MGGWESFLSIPVVMGAVVWYVQRQLGRAIEKIEKAATVDQLKDLAISEATSRKEIWIEVNASKLAMAKIEANQDGLSKSVDSLSKKVERMDEKLDDIRQLIMQRNQNG